MYLCPVQSTVIEVNNGDQEEDKIIPYSITRLPFFDGLSAHNGNLDNQNYLYSTQHCFLLYQECKNFTFTKVIAWKQTVFANLELRDSSSHVDC